MKKLVVVLLLMLWSYFSVAQSEKIPEMKTQKGFIKIDFLALKMPETNILNEPSMGFMGAHYNLRLNNYFYTGVGLYGSYHRS